MADIFEEVDEGLRKDDTALWWKKYGIFVWLACIGLVAFVAYSEWSTYQQARNVENQVKLFEAARTSLAAGDYEDAQRQFSEIVAAGSSISPLAAQYLAKTVYEGNGDAALAIQSLQQTQEGEGPIQRIALLKAAYLQSDSMTLTELESHLGDLTSEPTALGALALELVAAKAFKEGDLTRARREFDYLRFAPNAPAGVIERANIASGVLPLPTPAKETAPEETPVPEEIESAPVPTDGEETEQ